MPTFQVELIYVFDGETPEYEARGISEYWEVL